MKRNKGDITRITIALSLATIALFSGCVKETSCEGKCYTEPITGVIGIGSGTGTPRGILRKTIYANPFPQAPSSAPPIQIPACSATGDSIKAVLVSPDLSHFGAVYFALGVELLAMQGYSAGMVMGQYSGDCFFIEVQDVPPGYKMHLDLYANGAYHKQIDFTQPESDTANVSFQVNYTFK